LGKLSWRNELGLESAKACKIRPSAGTPDIPERYPLPPPCLRGRLPREVSLRAPSIQVLASDEEVFGEVPLAPYGLTGVSEAQLARTLARPPLGVRPAKGEAPRLWHGLVPHSPLTLRLAALAALMRR
jgi:hypothetical protein